MTRRLRAVPDAPLRAVDYRRVSMVGSREEVISPEIQGATNSDRAARDGWEVVDVLTDIDRTGRDFTRDGIQQAIAGVEEGRWQIIVVYKYDRFGRNVRDSLVNIARVEEAGGRVVSATEPFDAETAVGKYGRTNLLAVAELQSDLIGEGWRAAHRHRLARGLPHTMRPRFGYRIVDGAFEPDPETGPLLVECYRRYIAGETPRRIADWLNAMGSRTTAGRRWSANTLRPLLASGFAAGYLYSRKTGQHTDGAHEPLIDQRTWKAYQRRHDEVTMTPPRTRGRPRPLTGLVVCRECGAAMRWWAGKDKGVRYEAYRCRPDQGCGRNYVGYPTLLEAVKTELADVADELDRKVRQRTPASRAVSKSERAVVKGKIAEIQRALLRLTDGYARGITPEDAYEAVHADLVAEREGLETRLRQLDADAREPSRPQARKVLRDFDRLIEADPAGMQQALRALFLVVLVRPGRVDDKVLAIPRWAL